MRKAIPCASAAILCVGKDQWSIERLDGMLCYPNGPDGRQEDDPPIENFIFVDGTAKRILVCGVFDAWTLGEIVAGLIEKGGGQ